MSRTVSEHDARASLVCVGCNKEKAAGQIVCWECWRGGNNETNPLLVPFKFYHGTFTHWQMHVAEVQAERAPSYVKSFTITGKVQP